jgi:hypothetical protein
VFKGNVIQQEYEKEKLTSAIQRIYTKANIISAHGFRSSNSRKAFSLSG